MGTPSSHAILPMPERPNQRGTTATKPRAQVKGRRLDTEGGIRTRARARTAAEQWSAVPLRVKLVQLLTDAYIEASTQGGWGCRVCMVCICGSRGLCCDVGMHAKQGKFGPARGGTGLRPLSPSFSTAPFRFSCRG